MTEHSFDIVVLGGGSGGYAAALRGAELGKSVAIVERDKLGGTCLHRGCVPTKALLRTAEIAENVKDAERYGVTAAFTGIDSEGVRKYREKIVAGKFAGLTGLVKSRGITVFSGTGRLDADRRVRVGDDTLIGTDVIIATGARTRTVPGLDITGRVLGSTEALELDRVPDRVIILGGGVIGVEFASVWRSFGSEVTIVEALPHLAPQEDVALSKGLERAFRRRGIDVRLGARFQSATQTDDDVTIVLEDGSRLTADYLLVAVGRAPATEALGLEDAGVSTERGFLVVDDDLRTSAAGVWAVGDVVAGLQLAHRGFLQGMTVAERIAGLSPAPIVETQIPRVTYSHPELASVGLTEKDAADAFGVDGIVVREYNLAGNAKSEILGTSGLVKVVRQSDGPVLGVHLLGDRVGELITEGQLAVAWEAHPEDLAGLIHAHPTQSEALGEAFLALAGKPLHAL